MINCHKLRGLKTLFSCIMKIRSLKLKSWLGYFLYGGFKGNRPLTFFSFQRLPHILTNNPIHQSAQSLASLLTLILIRLLHSQETLVITLVQVIQDNRKVINLIISAKCLFTTYSEIFTDSRDWDMNMLRNYSDYHCTILIFFCSCGFFYV